MDGAGEIPRGPAAFEDLVVSKGLTEREADAARSLAARMTAADAAKVMGVSASTVASFRRRAYAKLGVETMTEFRNLPEVASWMAAYDTVVAHAVSDRESACLPAEGGSSHSVSDAASDANHGPSFAHIFLCCLLIFVLLVIGTR